MDIVLCFLFKQKTAYEMRISDWSSDVCSSDLRGLRVDHTRRDDPRQKCRLRDHDEQRGQRDAPWPQLRPARSLSGRGRLWLDPEVGGLVSVAADRKSVV